MTALVVRRYPQGHRVWIAGQRVHHGAAGCVLAAALARRHRRLALVAAALILHDRHDWRAWFAREALPVMAGELLDNELSNP